MWKFRNVINPEINIARVYYQNNNTLIYQITNFDLYQALIKEEGLIFNGDPPQTVIPAIEGLSDFASFVFNYYL